VCFYREDVKKKMLRVRRRRECALLDRNHLPDESIKNILYSYETHHEPILEAII